MIPSATTPAFRTIGIAVLCLCATIAQAAVTLDEFGWTKVTPSEDSRIIYVSSSEGLDTNDGLSPSTPKKTLAHARNFIRTGYPDHLLLKRGDTFPLQAGGLGRWVSGRSRDEPVLVSYYGSSGPRPIVEVTQYFVNHDGDSRDYIFFIGIDFYAPQSDPSSDRFQNLSSPTVFRFVGGGKYIHLEDCAIRYGSVTIQSLPAEFNGFAEYQDVVIRRNIVTDAWGHDSYNRQAGAQGIYLAGIKGSYVVEENFFDHCGWNETVEGAGANMYNHNLYIQSGNVPGGIIRGNITARGAAHGMQVRSGGILERNLFILNAIGANIGGIPSAEDPDVLAFPDRVTENVVINGRRMDPNNGSAPRTSAVVGLDPTAALESLLVEDNIVALRIHNGSNTGITRNDYATYVGNIVYKWNASEDMSDANWPHPDADMGDYHATLGRENDTIAYLEWLRTRPLQTLPWEMTAYAGINYIREGFNKDAVEGYYAYPSLDDTMWANWPQDSEGNVDTGSWLNWIYVDGDYIYSWNLDSWMYLPEEFVTEGGAWGYIFR